MALTMKKRDVMKILLSLNSPRLERCMVLGNTARKEVFGGRNLICRSHHTSKRNTKLEMLLHRGSHVAVRGKLSHPQAFEEEATGGISRQTSKCLPGVAWER